MEILKEIKELITAVGILIVIIFQVIQFIKTKGKSKVPGESSKALAKEVKIADEIYPVISYLHSSFRAMRSFIIQFSNGTHYLTGQSAQFFTVTHEVCSRGVRTLAPTHNHQPIDLMLHEILKKTREEDGYFYVEQREKIQVTFPALFNYMVEYEVKSLLYMRIVEYKTNETIALCCLHFPHYDALNQAQIYSVMNDRKEIDTTFNKL